MKEIVYYSKGYKYQLKADYTHRLSVDLYYPEKIDLRFIKLEDNKLTILEGYAWDGASGPTLDTKNTFRGSLVHDVLSQLMRMRLLPKGARKRLDYELGLILREDGMSKFRVWYWMKGLKRFGKGSTDPKNARRVFKAP